jgi:elongation factor 2
MHVVGDLDRVRNMGIVAHIDHGKTTLSDSLLANAGLISMDTAGKQLAMDFHEDEQQRGITINAANVSMTHEYEGQVYLINMIDTPGHVDFGGDVTRAMRAVDGVVVVCCAVEGVMPQTKTVLSQALKERCRPVVLVNKVDRLINELKLTPDELQKRLLKIIAEINKIIQMKQPEGMDWRVDVNGGSVAFGSGFHKWAINVPYMKKTGISFPDIIKYCNDGNQKELSKRAPVHTIILDMAVKHLPSPTQAQKMRIPQIWKGDLESEIGKSMMSCDAKGKVAIMITNIQTFDKREGEVATGRIFSGTVRTGQELKLINGKMSERVTHVGLYMGASRQNVEAIPAGNIVALTGLRHAYTGETVSEDDMAPFEAIQNVSEPVVTVAVEAKHMKDLPRVIEVLRQAAKEDPTLKAALNEETGEHLLSGMGELHLEVITNRIKASGLEMIVSQPIVVYRETIDSEFGPVEGKSPNKHNKFLIRVEPLEDEVFQAIRNGEIEEGRRKDRSKDIWQDLHAKGMEKEESRRVIDVYKGNMMLDMTKGVQHLDEVMELMLDGFEQVMDNGPLAKEPMTKVKVILEDVSMHEDAIHRGPAQIYPAVKNPMYVCILKSKPGLLEPMQIVWVDVPQEYMGSVTREMQRRRGIVTNMTQKDELMTIEAKVPVGESFGFAGDIRSATEGHALWSTENAGYARLPTELQNKVVTQIRDRKGLKKELPKAEDFAN